MTRLALVPPLLLAAGCTSSGAVQADATLRGLDDDKVYVTRRQETPELDVYTVTYVARVPPDVAWAAADDVRGLLEHSPRIRAVRTISRVELPDDEVEHRLEIEWSDGTTQRARLRQIAEKGLIDFAVDPTDQSAGDMAHVAIRMEPYRRNGTLVEAEIQVTSSFSSRVWGLLLLPVGLIGQGATDGEIGKLCNHIAAQHREAALAELDRRRPPTGRTHVVAIGAETGGAAAGRWEPIEYAEEDAGAFYAWATATCPADPGDPELVRELITGPAATDARISKVLGMLSDDDRVREGDTVVFYFAGHIDVEKDYARRSSFQYLLTANAEPDNLRATAIRKQDVLDAMRFSRASRCLFVCDACFSGGMRAPWVAEARPPRTHARGPVPRREFAASGSSGPVAPGAPATPGADPPEAKLSILAASREHDRALEREDLGHGVFTHVMLQGLGGGADADRDHWVSLEELELYVVKEVQDLTESRQTPYFSYAPGVDVRFRVAGSP